MEYTNCGESRPKDVRGTNECTTNRRNKNVTYENRHLSILVWDLISDNGQLQNTRNAHIFLRKSLNLSQPVVGFILETWNKNYIWWAFPGLCKIYILILLGIELVSYTILLQKLINWWKKLLYLLLKSFHSESYPSVPVLFPVMN